MSVSESATQLSLAPAAKLPLRPEEMIGLDPLERGRLYNDLDLDFRQREAIEEARRLILAGRYREAIG